MSLQGHFTLQIYDCCSAVCGVLHCCSADSHIIALKHRHKQHRQQHVRHERCNWWIHPHHYHTTGCWNKQKLDMPTRARRNIGLIIIMDFAHVMLHGNMPSLIVDCRLDHTVCYSVAMNERMKRSCSGPFVCCSSFYCTSAQCLALKSVTEKSRRVKFTW